MAAFVPISQPVCCRLSVQTGGLYYENDEITNPLRVVARLICTIRRETDAGSGALSRACLILLAATPLRQAAIDPF
jgi:hypothetical protein